VAGLGSRSAPSRDLSGHFVYAMRVEEAVSAGQDPLLFDGEDAVLDLAVLRALAC